MKKVTLFFDANVGRRLPEALKHLRPDMFDIKYHNKEGFKQGSLDDEIFESIGPKKWVMVSADLKWHKEPAHLALIHHYNIGCILFPSNNLRTWQVAECFFKHSRKIFEICSVRDEAFMIQLSVSMRRTEIDLYK